MNSFGLARGVLRVSGDDHVAFLHRMCTQSIESLQSGQSFLAAFLNVKGRLVEVVHGFLDDGSTLLVTTHPSAERLQQWLEGYVIVDDVAFEDLTSSSLVRIEVSPTSLSSFHREGDHMRSFDVVDAEGITRSTLLSVISAHSSDGQSDGEAFEILRVRSGIPGAPEVSDRMGPLELELHDALHWSKGCYIGQEVVSRIDNYQKQTKSLVGLRSPTPLPVGAEIVFEDKTCGFVTSSVDSLGDFPNALGLVKAKSPFGLNVVVEGVAAETCKREAAQIPHD